MTPIPLTAFDFVRRAPPRDPSTRAAPGGGSTGERYGSSARETIALQYMLASFALIVMGVGGFLGLLIASVYLPPVQDALRIMALAWFFAFGVVNLIVEARARRALRPRGPVNPL